MNFRTNSIRLLAPLCLLAVPGVPVLAQQPEYVPPPPPRKNVTVEVRMRYLFAPDISFSGLGSIPLRDSYGNPDGGGLLTGDERSILYDDGYLSQDYIETTLVGGGEANGERRPSTNTAATSSFGYEDAEQVDPSDPSALLFHRYASQIDPSEELAGASNGSLGWELNYTKYLDNRRNLGLQVGFSHNGFDSRFNDQVSADLYVEEFRHQMADGVSVPDLPDPIENADGTITQPPYEGETVREDEASGNLLEWASEMSTELIPDGATVYTKADLRSSIYNFRAGPTYAVGIGNRFGLQVGAGVSAIYFARSFSAYEELLMPDTLLTPSRGLSTTEDSQWQVGGYLDASAHYRFNPWVSVFSGMQVQSGSTYQQSNEDRYAEVDFGAQVYVHAGLGIRF